jgi:hypothetical protein
LFFELENSLLPKVHLLKDLIPDHPIVGYGGGLILRCDINTEMTGYFQLVRDAHSDKPGLNESLAKDVDTLTVWRDDNGQIHLAHGTAAFLYADGARMHVNKQYFCSATKNTYCDVMLSWSYNNFARFVIELLLRLEGKDRSSRDSAVFGQVFDILDPKPQ